MLDYVVRATYLPMYELAIVFLGLIVQLILLECTLRRILAQM